MDKTCKISIVLPAYNERENIALCVEKCKEAFEVLTSDYEIIVVDDGSSDKMHEVCARLVERNLQVKFYHHKTNQGYGAALRTGFANATGDYIFYTDADNQFDISELRYFIPLMEHYDVAIGFRVYRYDPVLRCFLSWCYNQLVSILFRIKVRDVDCSFKLFRKEVLEKIKIECNDFFVDTELIAKARKWNFRIIEKGVRHYPRMHGQTTVRPSHIFTTLKTVFIMWKRIYFPDKRLLPTPTQARLDVERKPVLESSQL